MEQDAVKVVRPKITAKHKYEGNGFYIEVDLAGADKESVELEVGTYGLSVKAEGYKIRYNGDYTLGYNIIPEKAKANYDNGVLYISLPIKEKSLKGTKVDITTT
jgi:HSP20 family molecular chaperone IbpA